MSTPEEIAVLVDLGLTSCQARVYLALCHFGVSDAKTVSKYSSVPRQDIYRIMAGLQTLGLVERGISRPVTFKALPIDKGTAILLKRREELTNKLESNVTNIVAKFKSKKNQMIPLKTEFIFIPQRDAIVEKIRNAIDKAKKSVDLVLSWERFKFGLYDFAEVLEKAKNSKVKFRFILEKPEKDEKTLAIELCRKNPYCEIKFLPNFPKTVMGIYDGKEIFVIVNPKARLPDSPALWSNSSSLMNAMQDYFNILWITSLEEPHLSIYEAQDQI